MSWTDKELSEMARKAEADQVFAYQDSFWSEMEAMLPAKKKRIWPFLLGITLPIIGASFFLFNMSNNDLETSYAAKKLDAQVNKNLLASDWKKSYARNENQALTLPTEKQNSTKNIEFQIKANQNVGNISGNNSAYTGNDLEVSYRINSSSSSGEVSKNELLELTPKVDIVPEVKSRVSETEESVLSAKATNETQDFEINQDINRLKFASISTFEQDINLQPSMLPYPSSRRFFSAYGELGFTVGEAYLTNQIGHVQAVNLGAGARITKNKLFVQLGLGFDVEKASVELQEITRMYNYSISTFENRMNYKEMYRATMPITLGYMMKKHTLQLGVAPSYLISSRMKYAYLENDLMKRNEMIYGETRGWNSFGMKVNVGYGFTILPSTTVGANFQVQLLNQLNENWAKDENKLPVSGQVFIRKTIR
jgi:hypothetical protein